MKKVVTHPVLGEINASRTRRASRLSLSVRSNGSVKLSYPLFVPHKQAMQFLETKIDWVIATRERLSLRYPVEPITRYSTQQHTLKLNPCGSEKISVKIKSCQITVDYPLTTAVDSDVVQQAVEKGIIEALRIEAKELLPPMVARLAKEHGFSHGEVRVKAARSKWGSCTVRNDINLSLFLMLLPVHLIEYIILHELCHTVHKNHSDRFHKLLDSVSAGHDKALNRELRAYRPDIRAFKS